MQIKLIRAEYPIFELHNVYALCRLYMRVYNLFINKKDLPIKSTTLFNNYLYKNNIQPSV